MAVLLKRIFSGALRIGFLAVIAVVVTLVFAQHSMIYHPSAYSRGEVTQTLAHFSDAVALDYTTSQGAQIAFYIPPANGQPPQRLWLAFGGNGSRAMTSWPGFIADDPQRRDGFLLVDYPGYGECAGSADPQTIEESADAALAQLQKKLANHEPPLCVIGHSLGCGVALQFAAKHNVERVVLLAPFTSLRAMAKGMVGWPLDYLLRHNFDNRACLAELAKRQPQPRVIIFHGTADEVIPFRMGRALADEFPKMITFYAIKNGTHMSILDSAESEIIRAMNASDNQTAISHSAAR